MKLIDGQGQGLYYHQLDGPDESASRGRRDRLAAFAHRVLAGIERICGT